MSSDEDFFLVLENSQGTPTTTMGGILKDIDKLKAQHALLIEDQQNLSKSRDEQLDLAMQFRQRTDRLRKSLQEDEISHGEELDREKAKLASLHKDEGKLKNDIEGAEEELLQLIKTNSSLEQQSDVSTAVPEKRVVFTAAAGEGANTHSFDVEPHIVFPMEGGTALVTFEEDVVAQKILELKRHKVELGSECTIGLEAKPVQLLMPDRVEMDTQVCPCRILVSDLPKRVPEDTLLDKLELHFNKKKNRGGDVDDKDFLHDSGNVVITFSESDVAKHLTDTQHHDVNFGKVFGKHTVKVTPFLNWKITNFEIQHSTCSRTILLTGIPAVMEQESLQDLLEIHFQKSANGGGEVDAILYNPLGQHTLALFQEDCPAEA